MVPLAQSQNLGSFEEISAANFFGVGARQMGMGGVGIATALDGASLYHNPAGLARLSAVEFQFGLTNQKFENRSSQPPGRFTGFSSTLNRAQADLSKSRFASVIISVPYPTYRGSLVIAGGITKLMSFDRASLLHVIDRRNDGLVIDDYSSESEEGAIYSYTVGAAIELSPHLSVGASLAVLSGDDRFDFENYYSDQTNDFIEGGAGFVSESYIGVSAKAGLLLRPNAHLAWGLTVESPVQLEVQYDYEEDWYQTDISDGIVYSYYSDDYLEYTLVHPVRFGTGLSLRSGTFMIAADIDYADWSQMKYQNNIELEIDNNSLKALYRSVLNWRAGIEYQYPRFGLALRGGIFSQPLPYGKANIENDRTGYSLGIGWLTGGHLLVEAAYLSGQFDRLYTAANNIQTLAEDEYKRIYLTISYR